MPAKKKPKAVELFAIKCDGYCVEIAKTQAEAKRKMYAYEKLYPAHMIFTVEPFKGKSAHCTSA